VVRELPPHIPELDGKKVEAQFVSVEKGFIKPGVPKIFLHFLLVDFEPEGRPVTLGLAMNDYKKCTPRMKAFEIYTLLAGKPPRKGSSMNFERFLHTICRVKIKSVLKDMRGRKKHPLLQYSEVTEIDDVICRQV